ncbi:Clavaminate synthase-like protein [Dioscorea alata]|uniref:Clavaminate synthase-like protein n=2 Tax=Dioscorea alata TaxID=55571 RepID=A0ACB7V0T9_DIOAL|nr:Clavaminate synthase-like protein [Dioscorea alata]
MSSWAATATTTATAEVPEGFAREAILAWYRGEFAAANAIIDALCRHIAQISDVSSEYDAVFAAIHRRRMNWIPVLHMQKYFSIADVAAELHRVSERRRPSEDPLKDEVPILEKEVEKSMAEVSPVEESGDDSSIDSKVPEDGGGGGGGASDRGSHCGKTYLDANQICSDPEVSATLPERIKVSKGFVSKEQAKGRMVNVVKGLKLYKDILTDSELSKLSEFVNELRLAGQRGELSGETFISFNKQMKGCKREIIQLGVPLFQPTKDEAANNMEPIPPVLQTVIDQLVQWRLLPGSKKPTSCIIDFFDEDESSQPYFKPPHLDNPISTLLLSDTTMAFGRVLTSDPQGNYKGSFTLPVQRGSLLVMRGNSADMARHVVCPSSNKRVCITFIKVKPPNNQTCSDGSLVNEVSQPGIIGYGSNVGGSIATWGPVIMLEPPKTPNGINIVPGSNGTGVFLPWSPGPKKFVRHLPPRIQKRRLPYLPTIMV